jgi:hypothetical protein
MAQYTQKQERNIGLAGLTGNVEPKNDPESADRKTSNVFLQQLRDGEQEKINAKRHPGIGVAP